MCRRFYSCIVFATAFWNVLNLSSSWQKLLNCFNYKKIKFQIILSNTMNIEFSRWWSSENIRKISQDLERKFVDQKLHNLMFFQNYYQKIFFRIQNLQLHLKKNKYRKFSQDFERKFLMKNSMISKDFAKMKSTFYSFFKLAKKWNSCFLRFFKLAKNEIHVFWGF